MAPYTAFPFLVIMLLIALVWCDRRQFWLVVRVIGEILLIALCAVALQGLLLAFEVNPFYVGGVWMLGVIAAIAVLANGVGRIVRQVRNNASQGESP